MYIRVNIHWGYTLCYIFWRPPIYIGWQYIHWGACGFCYPMYIPYIHWDTRIYIGTQLYTFDDINIHWVYTLCYTDNAHIHWVTLGIYIVVHYTKFGSCYTMYITMFPNVYYDVPQCIYPTWIRILRYVHCTALNPMYIVYIHCVTGTIHIYIG